MASRRRTSSGICGQQQADGTICSNAAGCRIPHRPPRSAAGNTQTGASSAGSGADADDRQEREWLDAERQQELERRHQELEREWERERPHDERSPWARTVDHFAIRRRYLPDHQAQDLYEAESRFLTEPPPGYERFSGAAEARKWANALMLSQEFRAAYPLAARWFDQNPLIVEPSRAKNTGGCAVVGKGTIRLSSFDDGQGMVAPVMIHELSHVVHGNSPADGFQQPHGAEFAAVYLDMTALVYGDKTAERLAGDFNRDGVAVDHDSRRIRNAGEGLIADGRLPKPSRQRTPETVTAARNASYVRRIERQARQLAEHAGETIEQAVNHGQNRETAEAAASKAMEQRVNRGQNREILENAVELGARLPEQVLRHLNPRAVSRDASDETATAAAS